MPVHKNRPAPEDNKNAIGTTRGIGPAYEDKTAEEV